MCVKAKCTVIFKGQDSFFFLTAYPSPANTFVPLSVMQPKINPLWVHLQLELASWQTGGCPCKVRL